MPAWLDMTLALAVVAGAVAMLVHNARKPRCASCPQPGAKAPNVGTTPGANGAVRVAVGRTRLGARGRAAN